MWLFITIKDNNSGKKLRHCYHIFVDLQYHCEVSCGKSLLKTVKDHEVCCRYLTTIVLKVDQHQTVLKAGMVELGSLHFILLARPLSPSGPTTKGWTLAANCYFPLGGGEGGGRLQRNLLRALIFLCIFQIQNPQRTAHKYFILSKMSHRIDLSG